MRRLATPVIGSDDHSECRSHRLATLQTLCSPLRSQFKMNRTPLDTIDSHRQTRNSTSRDFLKRLDKYINALEKRSHREIKDSSNKPYRVETQGLLESGSKLMTTVTNLGRAKTPPGPKVKHWETAKQCASKNKVHRRIVSEFPKEQQSASRSKLDKSHERQKSTSNILFSNKKEFSKLKSDCKEIFEKFNYCAKKIESLENKYFLLKDKLGNSQLANRKPVFDQIKKSIKKCKQTEMMDRESRNESVSPSQSISKHLVQRIFEAPRLSQPVGPTRLALQIEDSHTGSRRPPEQRITISISDKESLGVHYSHLPRKRPKMQSIIGQALRSSHNNKNSQRKPSK